MTLSKNILEAYSLLDLEPEADQKEVEASYRHLCHLYGGTDKEITIQLLEGEWSQEERSRLLEQIKRAYERIQEYKKAPQPEELEETLAETVVEAARPTPEYSGQELRRIREQKNIGLHDIYKQTQLPYKLFAHIEQEQFDQLPEAGMLRWYVTVYAKVLGLDAKQVADDYMRRFRRWMVNQG